MLYHGTSSRYLKKITKEGIVPRGNQNSNWSVPSQKRFVYLTDVFPIFFAVQARKRDKLVIVEIDDSKLCQDKLYPDDDFVFHMLKQYGQTVDLEEAGNLIKDSQWLWKDSLRLLGCLAHKGKISRKHIRRIAIIDVENMNNTGRMYFHGLSDVSISPIALTFRRKKAQQEIKWIFGDTNDILQMEKTTLLVNGKKEIIEKYVTELFEQRKLHIKVKEIL